MIIQPKDDLRPRLGVDLEKVTGPFSLRQANSSRADRVGGSLDHAIVAHLEDGREVLVGELWAQGVTADGPASLELSFMNGIIGKLNGETP